uniref:Uncharacterized protein n=1 Tax=Zea mays TaxID=4577 RepID=A0A804RKJ7_MAIZE
MGSQPRAVAISKGPEELCSQIQKKWASHNPADARGLHMGKKIEEGGVIVDGRDEPPSKRCSKVIVGTVECDILNDTEGSQAEVAKQNGQVVVTKNYTKKGEEVAAKPSIGHGRVAAARTNKSQGSMLRGGGDQGVSSKRMRLDVGAAREMNNSASWEGERRAEMIASQRIVGPGVVMDGHYRGEHHTLVEQSGCSNKQRAIPARVPVREQVDTGGKNMLIDVTQNVGPAGRASAGSVLDVGGKKNHGSVAPGTKPAPRWCPPGLSRTQKRRVQRLRTMEMTEKMKEEERDRWFNEDRPMVIPKKTWREKRLAREEKDDDTSSGSDKEESAEAQGDMDINMVFVLPTEFRAGEGDEAELTLGAERALQMGAVDWQRMAVFRCCRSGCLEIQVGEAVLAKWWSRCVTESCLSQRLPRHLGPLARTFARMVLRVAADALMLCTAAVRLADHSHGRTGASPVCHSCWCRDAGVGKWC